MGLFVMYGLDKAECGQLRKDTRPAHLQWIDGLGARVKLAGPLLSAEGANAVGSMIVVEADSLEAAHTLFQHDPYAVAGLWDSLEIRPFTQVRP
jgi:uncharacterized protein YciI